MEKTHICISVLVPVYNVEKYIERCMLSILHQTMQRGVEVIIVNDNTPDLSMEIIHRLLKIHLRKDGMIVRIIEHDMNYGIAAVRKTAMNYATGDYTIYIDSDDYVELDMLENMYSRALKTDADIVACDLYVEHSMTRKCVKDNISIDRKILLGEVIRHKHIFLWNKLVKRSLYTQNKLRWIEGIDYGEDYIMLLQLFFVAKRLEYIQFPYYHYMQNQSSICHSEFSEKKLDNWISTANFAIHYLQEKQIIGYESDLAYKVLNVKFKCIINSPHNLRCKYLDLYPEMNNYKNEFLSEMQASICDKIMYSLVLSGHVETCCFLLKIRDVIKKIVKG